METERERYCSIKAKTLEDILDTCNRHIRNINLTLLDTISEGDDDPSDHFYCDMFSKSWKDLRDDVEVMLENGYYAVK